MNILKNNLLILVVAFTSFVSMAQDQLPDGVKAGKAYIDTIVKNYSDENSILFDINSVSINVKLPVRLHIIYSIDGTTGVGLSDINSAILTANSFFEMIGISFFIDSVNYIGDYNYSFITSNENLQDMLTTFTKTGEINLFIADSIEMQGERCYGYTYFPDNPDSNYIFIDKQYVVGNYLTTMLGHFMGLLSTHETAGDSELADETNCNSAGDYICDTYADPGLLNNVDSTCIYTGTMKDKNSKYYAPSVANIMSDSPDGCKCKFTELQYRRMYYYYIRYRQYLAY